MKISHRKGLPGTILHTTLLQNAIGLIDLHKVLDDISC